MEVRVVSASEGDGAVVDLATVVPLDVAWLGADEVETEGGVGGVSLPC